MSEESNVVELDTRRGRAKYLICDGGKSTCVVSTGKLEVHHYDWASCACALLGELQRGVRIHPDVTEITLKLIPRPPRPPPEPPKPLAAVPGFGKPPLWRKILGLFVKPDLEIVSPTER